MHLTLSDFNILAGLKLPLCIAGLLVTFCGGGAYCQQLHIEGLTGASDTLLNIRTTYSGPQQIVGLSIHTRNSNAVFSDRGAVIEGGRVGMHIESDNFALIATSRDQAAASFSAGDFQPHIGLYGKHYLNQSDDDEGVIASAPFSPSSDLWLLSNDDVFMLLDENDDEDGALRVRRTSGILPFTVFSIDETGGIMSLGVSASSGNLTNRKIVYADAQGDLTRHDHPFILDVPCTAFNPGRYEPDEIPYYVIEFNSGANVSEWIAPIDLPNGSILKEVRALVSDNTPLTRAKITLRKISIIGGPGHYVIQNINSIETSNILADPLEISFSANDEKINNGQFFYDIELEDISSSSQSPPVRIYGIKIEYELP